MLNIFQPTQRGGVQPYWDHDTTAIWHKLAFSFWEAGRTYIESGKAELFDADACPTVYLYRQAMELYLKGIICQGNRTLKCRNTKEINVDRKVLFGHHLPPLMAATLKIRQALNWDWTALGQPPEIERGLEEAAKQLDKNDPISMAFRYPIDKKGRRTLPRTFRFDVRHFAQTMDSLLGALDVLAMAIEEDFHDPADLEGQARRAHIQKHLSSKSSNKEGR